MHAPIFYLLNIKIGAQSEQIWHLLRYRTSAPIIGATNNTASKTCLFFTSPFQQFPVKMSSFNIAISSSFSVASTIISLFTVSGSSVIPALKWVKVAFI